MSQDHDANANEQGWDGQSVYGPSTVIAALDQIEDLVESARSIPLSASIMVNKAEILDLLDQAREALPEDLVAADAVVADADAVLVRADSAAEQAIAEANTRASSTLEAANTKADQIVSAAREEAERTTSRADAEAEATLAQARADAEAALADARREEANLREGADDYVAQSLGELAGLISDLQRRTDAGRRTIAERRGVDVTDVELHD